MNIPHAGATVAILAVLLAFATFARSAQNDALQKQIAERESQGLDDLKSGNYDDFASLTADDAIFMDSHGSAMKAQVMENTTNFRLSSYTMTDVKLVRVSDSSGVLLYQLNEAGTSHGKDFTAKVNVSSLWAKRGGKWFCLFSQETAAR
ncbi:MAG TPA: nuclear transport factor 2 family protein [Candidatus Acidoferrales bacterium]|nr:nuclear transport factor 2 family protein [Candidatus Acidoferrales bacterium]